MSQKKIISCATSDLYSDQRVHRMCNTLSSMGFDVLSLGRAKKNSPLLPQKKYKTVRLKPFFQKGSLFYAEYNIRLLLFLLRNKADVILSNDLDTLSACAIAGLIKRLPVVYDSHEYFTEVPELIKRPRVRRVWVLLERLFIRRPVLHLTVSQSIANAYAEKYHIDFKVVRNLPEKELGQASESSSMINIRSSENEKIILYQGSVNLDRGLEEMIDAMKLLTDFTLVIVGDGDVIDALKQKVLKLNLSDHVRFTGRIPFEELTFITGQADIGLSIEKMNGLSYTYALPNKVFDYLKAGLPVLMTKLRELVSLNDTYKFGYYIDDHEAEQIAQKIREIFDDKEGMKGKSTSAIKASEDLNWEVESEKLRKYFSGFLDQV